MPPVAPARVAPALIPPAQIAPAHVAPVVVEAIVAAPAVTAPGLIGPVPGAEAFGDDTITGGTFGCDAFDSDAFGSDTFGDDTVGHDTFSDQTVVSVARKPRQAVPEPVDADHHDGLTVMSGDLRTLRGAARAAEPASVAAAPTASTLFLLLPGGGREALGHQPVVIGRAPSVSQVPGGQLPRLVSLGGADQDISRNHVRVTVEGDTVVVTDLLSRNGTVIVLPGRPPQKLRKGEAASVLVGTVIDLGGGVTLTVGEER
jgi:hypothetical protein